LTTRDEGELIVILLMQKPLSTPASEPIIDVRNVTREYTMGRKQTIRALDGLSLSVPRGTFLSILGPSGSGKSTLFNLIGGLDRPTSGEVLVDGIRLTTLSPDALAAFRCLKIGYIFQTYNLIPAMTALQNVAVPMTFAGLSDEEAEARAAVLLELVGLGRHLWHTPDRLSGGQQQRVAIARALANRPAILLADEPTGNLDKRTGEEIIELLRSLRVKEGMTLVCATHDLKMISYSDWVAWIRDGRLEKLCPRSELTVEEGHL